MSEKPKFSFTLPDLPKVKASENKAVSDEQTEPVYDKLRNKAKEHADENPDQVIGPGNVIDHLTAAEQELLDIKRADTPTSAASDVQMTLHTTIGNAESADEVIETEEEKINRLSEKATDALLEGVRMPDFTDAEAAIVELLSVRDFNNLDDVQVFLSFCLELNPEEENVSEYFGSNCYDIQAMAKVEGRFMKINCAILVLNEPVPSITIFEVKELPPSLSKH